MTKMMKRTIQIALILIVLWIVGGSALNLYTEWLWFKSVSFDSVFMKILLVKGTLFTIFTALFLVLVLGNLYLVRRFSPPGHVFQNVLLFGERQINIRDYFYWIIAAACTVLAFLVGLATISQWDLFLRYSNSASSSFGISDPIFNKDIAFYVLVMPFLSFIQKWLFGVFLFLTVGTAALYFFSGAIVSLNRGIRMLPPVRAHLFTLIGILLVLKGWGYRFTMYELLYTFHKSFFGAGFTDIYARLPVLQILLALSIATAFLFFINIFIKKTWLPIAGLGAMLLVSIVGGGIYPAIIQSFRVEPNEIVIEREYINNNIKYTRQAYKLDIVEEKPFSGLGKLSLEDVLSNEAVMQNIRLWDWRPLIQTFGQRQKMRPQYDFNDVDIDRYVMNGKPRQVMLSARELAFEQVDRSAQTWVNRTFLYTHGYGLAMSPVNEIEQEGLPHMFISNIPLEYDPAWKAQLKRPELYFGERTNYYIVVNPKSPKKREFDYPTAEGDAYTTYQGKGGVPISSFLRRIAFAWRFSTINLILSGEITSSSKILFHRQIEEMVQNVAPFLLYDSDPYLVISGGRLFWMVDAYTISNRYPYSEPLKIAIQGSPIPADANYMRNSVKVIIDAYNGDMKFYVMSMEKDPIIECYKKAFPALFLDFSQMPDDLKKHIRYPELLFRIQTTKYLAYHIQNPQTFYTKEDLWEPSTEKYENTEEPVEPYYLILKLPHESEENFMIMLPFTPVKRKNMIAWMAAACDLDKYGKMLVYRFPRGAWISGTMQIEARIDQNPDISQLFTLWGQKGSRVIRGNLLVIPILQSLLYVEPIYLQSEMTQIPELRRVIVAYGNSVAMGNNLEDALIKVFGGISAAEGEEKTVSTPTTKVGATVEQLAREAMEHYNAAQRYVQSGDWTKYGEELRRLKESLTTLQKKSGQK